AGRARDRFGRPLLGDRAHHLRTAVRRPLLPRHGWWDRLRGRRTRLPRLRIPGLHDRNDVPGFRHQSEDEADPEDRDPACAAVVSLRRRNPRGRDQYGFEPAPLTLLSVESCGTRPIDGWCSGVAKWG